MNETQIRQPIDALITLLVWDAHEAVSRLLDSIRRGVASGADWRLFILDQGSAQPTAGLIRGFADDMPDHVHLVRIDENVGYPVGHNQLYDLAVRNYSPRYLVTINSDLVFHDDAWLDHLVEFMDAHPLVGIAGPTGVVYQRTPPERIGWCRVADAEELRAEEFDSISGSVCAIRQTLIDEIGLFDESFTPGYYEDTDLAFRAKACGWRIAACEIAHGHHEQGPEQSTSYIKREELAAKYGNFQKRNRNLFVARWLVPTAPIIDSDRARFMFPRVYFPSRSPNYAG